MASAWRNKFKGKHDGHNRRRQHDNASIINYFVLTLSMNRKIEHDAP
jgi:hypothetical protein